MEAFHSSPKFSKIKVALGEEEFAAGHEERCQQIMAHHPEWDLSFLDKIEKVEDLLKVVLIPTMEGPPPGSIIDDISMLDASKVQPLLPPPSLLPIVEGSDQY